MNENFPAVAIVKKEYPQTEPPLRSLLAQMLADKGIGRETICYLAHQSPHFLGMVFGHLIMRSPYTQEHGHLLKRTLLSLPSPLPTPTYQGTKSENSAIDAIWEHQGQECGLRSITWRGAAGAYESTQQINVPLHMRKMTLVVIIGAGAAGILAARALLDVGFPVVLFDQTGNAGGVWNQDFLRDASRANPFPLRFEQHQLDAAPGSGSAVMEWLEAIMKSGVHPFPLIKKARVIEVRPGDVSHTVLYENERGERQEFVAPIVINAVGVGEPLPPSRPGVMTTDIDPAQAGTRWQTVWSPKEAHRHHGRTILFIGLSNSTIEMVKQIQRYRRGGLDINYRILTHYPQEALFNPSNVVFHNGHKMRLYRNPDRLQLLRLAGDIPEVARAFEEARDTDHITSHITSWSLEHGAQPQVVAVREDGVVQRYPYNQLYTLIGYGPKAETLSALGLHINNPYLGAVDLDYDSEVQRAPGCVGRSRLCPGYFCFGIRNAFNMNEVVLPGLLFRLPDLVAGVILRSSEYCLMNQSF
ncbi:FAD-dependent oxidoreductase [Tengunoibacter tsumagoiensis]|uniref:FAD/NAD(P)-binding domain-containing protein n=1 Tax=Tengunoibacter tsumagoiensis TaxID=2014871 RepID=A0A402A7V0_9CHLR|nr:FAD-dependent oxidoreductase [Tengunoibacter tsumagoiensis]GCE15076.1 hypothetical protein KTT_49350 [Tengunoibacter tsumagoiensis]